MNNKELLESLSNMSVLDLCELTRELENKWGLVGITHQSKFTGFPQAFPPLPQYIFEQTEFSVILKSFPPDKKISILKVIREVTGLPLTESKMLLENLPQRIKEFISNVEADDIALKLKRAEAEIEVE